MRSYRENPDSPENQAASKQNEREVFAAKMMAQPEFPPGFNRTLPTRDGAVYEVMLIQDVIKPACWDIAEQAFDVAGENIPYWPKDVLCWRLLVPAEEVTALIKSAEHYIERMPKCETTIQHNDLMALIESLNHARRVVEGGMI